MGHLDAHHVIEPWRSRRARWDRTAGKPRPSRPVVVDLEGGFVHCGDWVLMLRVVESRILLAIAGAYPEPATHAEVKTLAYGDASFRENTLQAHISKMRRRLREAGAPFTIDSEFGIGWRLKLKEAKQDDGRGTA